MSAPHEPVRPAAFDPPRPHPAPAHAGAPSRHWLWLAFAALLALALLVIFWLPTRVAPPAQPAGSDPTVAVNAGDRTEPGSSAQPKNKTQPDQQAQPGSDATPWADAQAARLRKDAKDIMAELLDLQSTLQQRGVERWAAAEYSTATAAAKTGDNAYQTRDFAQARSAYEQALQTLRAIEASMPQRAQAQLDAARAALAAGEVAATEEALALTALLAPDHADLAALQARAAALPKVLPLLADAAAAEAAGDLMQAEQRLIEAAALDPARPDVAADIERIRATLREQAFQAAMSDGYAALDAGDTAAARRAFERAVKARPDAKEAATALQEISSRESARRLRSLQQQGAQREAAEDWQAAADSYRQAQAIDTSVVFADDGLARAAPRAELDRKLRELIDRPETLTEPRGATTAQTLLAQAAAVPAPGPVLQGQIARLTALLRTATTPVAVTLRSDQATEVTLLRVQRLGRFQEQQLSLRPGTYTAVGSRDGYRDVRRQFTVHPDRALEPVSVVCTERI